MRSNPCDCVECCSRCISNQSKLLLELLPPAPAPKQPHTPLPPSLTLPLTPSHAVLRFLFTSLATPATVVDFNMASGKRSVKKVQQVLGGFDRSMYRTERVWATAPDGVKVRGAKRRGLGGWGWGVGGVKTAEGRLQIGGHGSTPRLVWRKKRAGWLKRAWPGRRGGGRVGSRRCLHPLLHPLFVTC
jgi:hypothetical protein